MPVGLCESHRCVVTGRQRSPNSTSVAERSQSKRSKWLAGEPRKEATLSRLGLLGGGSDDEDCPGRALREEAVRQRLAHRTAAEGRGSVEAKRALGTLSCLDSPASAAHKPPGTEIVNPRQRFVDTARLGALQPIPGGNYAIDKCRQDCRPVPEARPRHPYGSGPERESGQAAMCAGGPCGVVGRRVGGLVRADRWIP